MERECLLCETVQETNEARLCSYCQPDTCVNCPVDSVSFVDGRFKCSHGCKYTVQEYMEQKLYTTVLNGTWEEKLALAGCFIEYIIPNTNTLTIYSDIPEEPQQDAVYGVHYTPTPKELVKNGFDDTMQRETNQKYYPNTVRETAAYAWPYYPEYTKTSSQFKTEDYVIFEIPEDDVSVSSYRLLDFASDTGEYTIPVSKYDEELTFTPEQLFTVCEKHQRPTKPERLFQL